MSLSLNSNTINLDSIGFMAMFCFQIYNTTTTRMYLYGAVAAAMVAKTE